MTAGQGQRDCCREIDRCNAAGASHRRTAYLSAGSVLGGDRPALSGRSRAIGGFEDANLAIDVETRRPIQLRHERRGTHEALAKQRFLPSLEQRYGSNPRSESQSNRDSSATRIERVPQQSTRDQREIEPYRSPTAMKNGVGRKPSRTTSPVGGSGVPSLLQLVDASCSRGRASRTSDGDDRSTRWQHGPRRSDKSREAMDRLPPARLRSGVMCHAGSRNRRYHHSGRGA